MNNKM